MKDKLYVLHTKNETVRVQAKNRDYAFAKFFQEVASGKIPIEKLGNIVVLKDRKTEYPFRTVPLLWHMKILDKETAVANIITCTGVTEKEAEKMLSDMALKDSRFIPLIEELTKTGYR